MEGQHGFIIRFAHVSFAVLGTVAKSKVDDSIRTTRSPHSVLISIRRLRYMTVSSLWGFSHSNDLNALFDRDIIITVEAVWCSRGI
jgi:hypothetical protein